MFTVTHTTSMRLTATIASIVLLLYPFTCAYSSAVVVMYHHFGDARYPSTNIRLDQFEDQLRFLETSGFNVWPLNDIVARLASGGEVPDKTIAITMDDAYVSVYTEAYPRLKQRNWPFTVFVSTGYIDKKFPNYMSWAQMREMQASGASFGNHSTTHDSLIRRLPEESESQWRQRVDQDIRHAQQRLNAELDHVVPLFAYPYGEYDLALADIVAKTGLTGFGQQSGALGKHSDSRFLPRFPINEAYGELAGFRTKALSLALPVETLQPVDPVTTTARPQLTLMLAANIEHPGQLACYAGAQGALDIQWMDKEKRRFSVQAGRDLPGGRSRYNCTAPAGSSGRYYWFSQLWIRPHNKP